MEVNEGPPALHAISNPMKASEVTKKSMATVGMG
jgi:hypothetical protein